MIGIGKFAIEIETEKFRWIIYSLNSANQIEIRTAINAPTVRREEIVTDEDFCMTSSFYVDRKKYEIGTMMVKFPVANTTKEL